MMMANTDGSSLNGSFMILVGSIKLWQIRLVVIGKLVTKSARSHLTWTTVPRHWPSIELK